jgi:proteic killer suppression protein
MIISFVHKGLEKFYSTGKTSGIQKKHEKKVRLILSNLDQAIASEDMDLQAFTFINLKVVEKEYGPLGSVEIGV